MLVNSRLCIRACTLITEIKSQFGEFIGTYCFDGNVTRPAIRYDSAKNDCKVTGVEIIVERLPFLKRSQLSNYCLDYCYTVRLVQHGDSEEDLDNFESLFVLIGSLTLLYSEARMLPGDSSIGILPQAIIKLYFKDSE